MNVAKLVVGLAGMPGAGKSVFVNVARDRNYDIIVMGDEVREEARRRGLEPTLENIGRLMLELRQLEGETVIAQRCLPKIPSGKKEKIVIDGIRSLAEVEEFRKNFKSFVLVAVHSSPETRFKRIYNRRRSDDPKDWEIFRERDLRELSVGLGNAIAMAEHMIVNEESLDTFKKRAKKVLERIEEKWMS